MSGSVRPCCVHSARRCVTRARASTMALALHTSPRFASRSPWIQEGYMQGSDRLLELCHVGRMQWTGEGWLAEPDEVVDALARDGFQECKREVTRNPASRAT